MIVRVKKLIALIRRIVLKLLIRLRLPLHARAKIGDKTIFFHNVSKSYITEQIAYNGFEGYEYELGHFIKHYPFDFKSFIDAGANIGFYSTMVRALYGDEMHISAIEAFPNNVRYMETLQKNNNIQFNIIPRALTEKTGETKEFFVPTSHRSSSLPPAASLINNFKGSGGVFNKDTYEIIEVQTIHFSDVIADNKGPFLIKLDIEGYELPVLKSIEDKLRDAQDIDFVIELMINDTDKKDVFNLMMACGYAGYLITNAGLIAEDRPLTLPYHTGKVGQQRTCWKNHYFTKRPAAEIEAFSREHFGYSI